MGRSGAIQRRNGVLGQSYTAILEAHNATRWKFGAYGTKCWQRNNTIF